MKIFENIKQNVTDFAKMMALYDLQALISRRESLQLAAVFSLNLISSAAKLLAPASLAKAVELFLNSDKPDNQNHDIKFYMVLSLSLSAWIKFEAYIKNNLLCDFEEKIIINNTQQLVQISHQVSLDQHVNLKNSMTQLLMEIVTSQAKLPQEVMGGIYQVFLDIILGSILIWYQYGVVIGSEFLAYCMTDLLVFRAIIACFADDEQLYNQMNKKFSNYLNHEFEILMSEETVRLFSHESFEKDKSMEALQKYLLSKKDYIKKENIAVLIKLIPFFAANLIPISFIFKSTLKLSDFDDFIFLFGYINSFSTSLMGLNNSIKNSLRATRSISKLQLLIAELAPEIPNDQTLTAIAEFDPMENFEVLTFENVSFSYPNSELPILKNVSFDLPAGKKIAIVGRSGVGKSTIIKLLYGMYRPQSGEIKINGVNINEISREILTRFYCCVPQESVLFRHASLKYNVLYGAHQETMIKNYLEIKKFVKNQRSDYQTYFPVFEKFGNFAPGSFSAYRQAQRMFTATMNKVHLRSFDNDQADKKASLIALSGGQKQRVSIARALMRNSSIFLLDEPTAALDSFTEYEILNNIKEVTADKAAIMITHRLSTIQDADEILVLDDGMIVERGTHDELLAKEELYSDYFNMQQGYGC